MFYFYLIKKDLDLQEYIFNLVQKIIYLAPESCQYHRANLSCKKMTHSNFFFINFNDPLVEKTMTWQFHSIQNHQKKKS